MAKVIAAALLSLLIVTPVVAADSVTIFLAFVFYTDKGVQKTVTVGGASMKECQEVFKAFLQGVDGATVEDFSVAACKGYSLSDLPRS
jgi:hypothetical protein